MFLFCCVNVLPVTQFLPLILICHLVQVCPVHYPHLVLHLKCCLFPDSFVQCCLYNVLRVCSHWFGLIKTVIPEFSNDWQNTGPQRWLGLRTSYGVCGREVGHWKGMWRNSSSCLSGWACTTLHSVPVFRWVWMRKRSIVITLLVIFFSLVELINLILYLNG